MGAGVWTKWNSSAKESWLSAIREIALIITDWHSTSWDCQTRLYTPTFIYQSYDNVCTSAKREKPRYRFFYETNATDWTETELVEKPAHVCNVLISALSASSAPTHCAVLERSLSNLLAFRLRTELQNFCTVYNFCTVISYAPSINPLKIPIMILNFWRKFKNGDGIREILHIIIYNIGDQRSRCWSAGS